MYGWHFVGSDITDVAVYHAQQNVNRNTRLHDAIRIVKVSEDTQEILIPVTQKHGPFDFCMCNPPFFSSIEEAGRNQKTAFGGTSAEMVYPGSSNHSTKMEPRSLGGEGAFVQKMVQESTTLDDQIVWYSAMMGKKTTFKTVKRIFPFTLLQEMVDSQIRKMLYTIGPAALRTTTFEQGKMTRWAIAWSFVAKNTDDKPLKPILPSTPILHVHPFRFLSRSYRATVRRVAGIRWIDCCPLSNRRCMFTVRGKSHGVRRLLCTSVTRTIPRRLS